MSKRTRKPTLKNLAINPPKELDGAKAAPAVEQAAVDSEKTAQPIPQAVQTKKILGLSKKALTFLIGGISLFGTVLGIFGWTIFDLLPSQPTATPTGAVTSQATPQGIKPSATPVYVLILQPTRPPANPGSQQAAAQDPEAPEVVQAQALAPNPFHGEAFSAQQIACMTPSPLATGAYRAEFLPGGQELALEMSGGEHQIGVWNLQNSSWVGQLLPGTLLTQSPFGPLYIVGGYEYEYPEVRLARDGSLVFTIPNPEQPVSFAVSQDGTKFVFGFYDGKIIVYDLPTGRSFPLLSSGQSSEVIVFSPDDSLIAAGGPFAPINLWNIATHSPVAKIDQGGRSFAFSREGKELVFVDYESGINGDHLYSFDLETQQVKTLFEVQDNWNGFENVRMYMSRAQNLLRLGGTFWNLGDGTVLRNLKEHLPDYPALVVGSFEGDRLVSITHEKMILWDLNCSSAGVEAPKAKINFEKISPGSASRLQMVKQFENGGLGNFAAESDRFVMEDKVYSATTLEPISDFSDSFSGGSSTVISPDGKLLAVPGTDTILNIWDVDASYLVKELSGCGISPAFLSDGSLMAVNVDREVCLWKNINAPAEIIPFQDFYGYELDEYADFDHAKAAVSVSTVYQINREYYPQSGLGSEISFALADIYATDPKPMYVFKGELDGEQFSPAGTYLAAVDRIGHGVFVFRVEDQSVVMEIPQRSFDFRFSADEQLFAVSIYEEEKVLIYNTNNWQVVAQIDDPKDIIGKVRFSSDGHYLALGGNETTWFYSVGGK